MNNYAYFKCQPKDYGQIRTKSNKVIYKQVNAYLKYCAFTRQMSRETLRAKHGAYQMMIVESGCCDLREFTNKRFDKFVQAEIERGISARTINNKIAHIIALVRYYREMDLDVPLRIPLVAKLKELPPRRVCYTREQIEYVLDKCQTDLEWLFIKIAFDTGMRIKELTCLSIEEITGRRIDFIGKGQKDREVYLSRSASKRLYEYIERNRIVHGRIWLNDWGYPICTDTVRRIMRTAFNRCGFNDFYPHALRHSFGSDIQRQGADVMVIKEMMGHSNVATTQKYLHSLDGQLENLFDKYKA